MRRRGRRRRGGLLVFLRAGRRIVITGVHALGNSFWIGAFQADRGRALQDKVGQAHVDRDVGVEISAEAKDALYSFSLESLERLIPLFGTLAREARECQKPLGLRYMLPRSIVLDPGTTRKDLRGAKEELESILRTTRRIFGEAHPRVGLVRTLLEETNRQLSTEF